MKHPYLLLLLAPFIWGGNAVAGKLAVGEISPMVLTFYRWFFALVILFPFALPHLKKDLPNIKKHFVLLFVLGCLGFSIFNLLIYQALHYTSTIKMTIEQAAIPIFILLGNFIFLKTRCNSWQLIGLGIAIFGVITTVSNGNYSTILKDGVNRGDILMLFASLAYAAYSFGLRWRPVMHWMSFIFVLALSACIFSFPFFISEVIGQADSNVLKLSLKGWGLIAYVSIFASIIAQAAYANGVAMIGSNRAGQFINMVPIFGTLLSVIILGETFRWYHGLGLILVLGGIILAEKAGKAANR